MKILTKLPHKEKTNLCWIAYMDDEVNPLIIETCKHPVGSLDRQKGVTKIVRLMIGSNRIWHERVPFYEDALQQTWLHFCRNLCESITGQAYDPERANVFTWMNNYLKWRLKSYEIETMKEQKSRVTPSLEEELDLIENLAAPELTPDFWQPIEEWIKNETKLRRIHVQNCPQANAQFLILKRLPPETIWQELSIELGVSVPTLSGFYQKKCIPLLRDFCELNGYLEKDV